MCFFVFLIEWNEKDEDEEDLEEWEEKVGIKELDKETIAQLRKIARKTEEILEEE